MSVRRPIAPAPTWLWRAIEKIGAFGDPDVRRLVASLTRYREEAHLGLTVEQALGLYTPPDLRPWHACSLAERRDELLAEFADLVGGSVRHVARAINVEARRFEACVWPRCRSGATAPRGRRQEILFELHRLADAPSGPRWPLSDRQLRERLGGRTANSVGETARHTRAA